MLKRLIRKINKRVNSPMQAWELRDRYPEYEIGSYSYGDLIVQKFDNVTNLQVGKYCSFGPRVQILLGGDHRLDWVTTFPFNTLWKGHQHIEGHPASKGNIVIGNDVWVGNETLIMSGVSIGDGAVIAARSIVTMDVAPYSIVAGSPAKELRKRFSAEQIEQLMALQWWNWPDERVNQAIPLLLQPDIQAFINAANGGEI